MNDLHTNSTLLRTPCQVLLQSHNDWANARGPLCRGLLDGKLSISPDEQLGQSLGILSWGQYLNHYLLFIYF